MNRKSTADRRSCSVSAVLLFVAATALAAPFWALAQVPVDENGTPLPVLDDEVFDASPDDAARLGGAELEELVGPVALYPDDLLAIVLPASTYPLEIVQAARFLDELASDSSLEPDASWDESVVALLNYPEVVYLMDQEIDWTWRLGEAVMNQQADVLAAVETFRDRAYAAGNLKSDLRQTVTYGDGVIEIDPVDEDIIYVPYYEPEEVVVYQPQPVYYYYPYAYPVYYYPYPVGYSFASGYFWGVTTAYTIGWHNHYLHVYHPSYWGHPYYGHHYYGHYYRRPSIAVYNSWYVHNGYRQTSHRYRDGDYWRPRHRSGARPASQSVRNDYGGSRDRSEHRVETRADYSVRQQQRNADRSRNETDRTRAPVANAPIQRATRDRSENRRDAGDAAIRQRLAANNTRETAGTPRPRRELQSDRPAQRQSTERAALPNRSQAPRVEQRQAPPAERRETRAAVERQGSQQRQVSRQPVQRPAPSPDHAERPAAQQRQVAPPARVTAPQVQVRQASGPRQGSQAPDRRRRD